MRLTRLFKSLPDVEPCPEPIRKALLVILQEAFYRMRTNPHLLVDAATATHLHIVPEILYDFRLDQLRVFLELKKVFIEETKFMMSDSSRQFEPEWTEIEREYRRLVDSFAIADQVAANPEFKPTSV